MLREVTGLHSQKEILELEAEAQRVIQKQSEHLPLLKAEKGLEN